MCNVCWTTGNCETCIGIAWQSTAYTLALQHANMTLCLPATLHFCFCRSLHNTSCCLGAMSIGAASLAAFPIEAETNVPPKQRGKQVMQSMQKGSDFPSRRKPRAHGCKTPTDTCTGAFEPFLHVAYLYFKSPSRLDCECVCAAFPSRCRGPKRARAVCRALGSTG